MGLEYGEVCQLYQAGDMIVYGNEGVCRVVSVGTPQIAGVDRERQYYTLEPQYCDGLIFAPVDTPVHTRPVMSREEAESLIDSLPEIEAEPAHERMNVRLLNEHYRELIRTCDRHDIAKIIKEVRAKRIASQTRGGKISQVDEKYMKRAEDLLYGEMSISLGIPRDEVCDYITRRIEAMELKKEA